MKQIIQDLKNGNTFLEDVPAPAVKDGYVLIRSVRSLVSAGTEKMLVSFGKAGWLGKARQQPDRVKDVLAKIKTDGLRPTVAAVLNKLDKPIPLGYSNAGVVIGVGNGVKGFAIGDRVVSNGAHAAFVSVPQNLVAKIPGNVTDDQAAFTVIGAIALQGIRLINPGFGEHVVVVGLGLIGQLAMQLLKANGCRVTGIEPNGQKAKIAADMGFHVVTDPAASVSIIHTLTGGNGADAVLITASSPSDDIIAQAAKMSRKRGRIVLTGVVGLQLNRADFYEKELSFQVSCSYGPGRYDADYEQKGIDYPIGFVRWTEQRNFEAVLHALHAGQLSVDTLISAKVPLEDYQQIYNTLEDGDAIASLLCYPADTVPESRVLFRNHTPVPGKMAAGIAGSGNFAMSVVLPLLKKQQTNIVAVVSENGLSATAAARKYNIPRAATDFNSLLDDADCNTIFILTRHHQHAGMVVAALNAGKHVFVEKPLAITRQQLDDVKKAHQQSRGTLSVGFNRRHAPLAQKMKKLVSGSGPVNIVITVNAGFIPATSWVHDPATGGGRIIGEVCHFIDLCCYLGGGLVKTVYANLMSNTPAKDNLSIVLQLDNGSNVVVNYFANGSKTYDKERVELYSNGRTLVMENWRKLTGYGFDGFSSATAPQDKGHAQQFKNLETANTNGTALMPFEEIVNVTEACFAIEESITQNELVRLV